MIPRVFDIEAPDLVWASPPMKIGDHEWIVGVYEHRIYGRETFYAFRGPLAPEFIGNGMFAEMGLHWPDDYEMSDAEAAKLEHLYGKHRDKMRTFYESVENEPAV